MSAIAEHAARSGRRAAWPWLLALAVLGLAVYARHLADGGFYWDDWQLAARARFPPTTSADFHGAIDLTLLGYRPVLALLLPAIHAVLGPHPALHIGLAIALAIATGACFFAFLRSVGLEPVHAAAIAGLSMVFPWADSMRLWSTAAINTVAVCLYLLGTVAALAGLRTAGRRRVALTAAALLLYGLSVLTYEVAAAAALLSVILYAREVGWTRAWRRWALDVPVVAAPLLFVALNTPRRKEPLSGQMDHAQTIADQALSLAARALVPVDGVPRGIGLAVLACLAAGGVALRRRPDVRRWLIVAASAVVGVAASYALIVPADAHYQPLAPGVNNRINLLAALPYAALAYAAAMLAGALLRARWVAVVAVLALAAGWTVRTERDVRAWDRSAAAQDRVLDAVARALPDPPEGTTVYTFGERTYEAPGVPIFSVSWDLKAAVRLRLDRPHVLAYALSSGTELECGARRVTPRNSSYGPRESAGYRRAFAVDVPAARAIAIDSPRACRAVAARLAGR